ncbi:MAG TPA: hypothetical protein PLU30_06905 [Verrucomicrobiae bacterium]|nr:hypothetical protein [Verrucomicrobiae bacterium]
MTLGPFLVLSRLSEHLLDTETFQHLIRIQNDAYEQLVDYNPLALTTDYVDVLIDPRRREREVENTLRMSRDFIRSAERALGKEPQPEPEPTIQDIAQNYREDIKVPFDRNHNLSRLVPWFFRPITAVFDVLLHLFFDAGIFGFIVALVQTVIGAGLMILLLGRVKCPWAMNHQLLGMLFPIGTVVAGSIAALFLLGFVRLVTWVTGFHLSPLAAQSAGSLFMAWWVSLKIVEHYGSEAIAKRLRRFFRMDEGQP